ncbi:MAG: hypothetical protein J6J23_07545 [Clostridia bacterium]|nr:hypothetical protein [Clostridia bacterium]
MEYTIDKLEDTNNKTFKLSSLEFDKKELKNALLNNYAIELHFKLLNLDIKLYGSNKKETIAIQKENCNHIIKVYKTLSKIVKIAKKYNFNGTFFVKNLEQKKNNNDYLLTSLLNLKFNTFFLKRLTKSIFYTCEFLDRENSLHNMCDFHDNKCAKHRARGFERSTGCCPASCKFMDNCPCKTKNLSCKLIMCDYLVDMGYYFTPHTIPTLRLYMNPLERLTSIGMFFKSTKKTYLFMWTVRILEILISFALLYVFISELISLFI